MHITLPNDPATGYGVAGTDSGYSPYSTDGLTKREYFAALAMKGNLSACTNSYPDPKILAEKSIEYADALIVALNATEIAKVGS